MRTYNWNIQFTHRMNTESFDRNCSYDNDCFIADICKSILTTSWQSIYKLDSYPPTSRTKTIRQTYKLHERCLIWWAQIMLSSINAILVLQRTFFSATVFTQLFFVSAARDRKYSGSWPTLLTLVRKSKFGPIFCFHTNPAVYSLHDLGFSQYHCCQCYCFSPHPSGWLFHLIGPVDARGVWKNITMFLVLRSGASVNYAIEFWQDAA